MSAARTGYVVLFNGDICSHIHVDRSGAVMEAHGIALDFEPSEHWWEMGFQVAQVRLEVVEVETYAQTKKRCLAERACSP